MNKNKVENPVTHIKEFKWCKEYIRTIKKYTNLKYSIIEKNGEYTILHETHDGMFLEFASKSITDVKSHLKTIYSCGLFGKQF